jgi:hypothetical protein
MPHNPWARTPRALESGGWFTPRVQGPKTRPGELRVEIDALAVLPD